MGIKIFKNLPLKIKDLSHNIKQLKLVLRNILYSNSFILGMNGFVIIVSKTLVGFVMYFIL